MVALRGGKGEEVVSNAQSQYSSGCFEGWGGRVGTFKYPVIVVVALRGGEGE